MSRVLVCGAGGFIGAHLVSRLKADGAWVRAIGLKHPEFSPVDADQFVIGDLRDPRVCREVIDQPFDQVYQLAAEMGGAGFTFTGDHDAAIMSHSALINVNVALACGRAGVHRLFFPSSACVYPASVQRDPADPHCAEPLAYPAQPDSEYGWEKLFAERLYAAHARNGSFAVRIARFHAVYGPRCTWRGGREKALAALCRKVAEADEGGEIEMWGDGAQTRSFMHVDDAIEGVLRLMRSDFEGPVNLGSEEMISIRALATAIIELSGKHLGIRPVAGPEGVRGRNSDNRLLRQRLGWSPRISLRAGLATTYSWIASQVEAARAQKGIAATGDAGLR